MRNLKTIFCTSIIFFAFTGICFAQTSLATEDPSQLAPYYLAITWENTDFQSQPVNFSGEINITDGKFTIGKSIAIGTDETLETDTKDIGAMSSKLLFNTKVKSIKGVILRIFPDQNKAATLSLKINQSLDGKNSPIDGEILLDANADSTLVKIPQHTFLIRAYSVTRNQGLSLENRNLNFYYKLSMLNRSVAVLQWAEAKYESGEISLDDFLSVKSSLEKLLAWKEIKSELSSYFNLNLTRLVFKYKKGQLTPEQFVWGLKRVTNWATR